MGQPIAKSKSLEYRMRAALGLAWGNPRNP
jgi:hypothetical protein